MTISTVARVHTIDHVHAFPSVASTPVHSKLYQNAPSLFFAFSSAHTTCCALPLPSSNRCPLPNPAALSIAGVCGPKHDLLLTFALGHMSYYSFGCRKLQLVRRRPSLTEHTRKHGCVISDTRSDRHGHLHHVAASCAIFCSKHYDILECASQWYDIHVQQPSLLLRSVQDDDGRLPIGVLHSHRGPSFSARYYCRALNRPWLARAKGV